MKNLRRNLVLTIILGAVMLVALVGNVQAAPLVAFQNGSTTPTTTENSTPATNAVPLNTTPTNTTPASTTNTAPTNTPTSGTVTLNTTNTAANRVAVNNIDASKDLPQTGENDIYIVTAVGAIALVIGGVAYIKSRKYDM